MKEKRIRNQIKAVVLSIGKKQFIKNVYNWQRRLPSYTWKTWEKPKSNGSYKRAKETVIFVNK